MRPSGRETSKASSGSSIPQKIIDVVVPVGVSNEICEATYATGLEEAFSVPLLEGNGADASARHSELTFPQCPLHATVFCSATASAAHRKKSKLPSPTPKRLDGERDETSPRQGPSWIPPMFVCGGSCSGCAVLIGSLAQASTALGVRDDDVPVDEGIRWRTLKAVVQPRLFHL